MMLAVRVLREYIVSIIKYREGQKELHCVSWKMIK